jgi:glycosyltransferase involved in cell wall biosynthesis
MGVSSARNLGIQKATCEWIAFLDSDDEWHKDKLKEQVAFHKKHKNILISYTDEVWIRDNKEIKVPKKFKKIGKDAFLENLHYCNIAPSSVLIHKSIFDSVGVFDENMDVCEDYDLWLRIASSCEIALLDKKLILKYAGHQDQLSFKHWGMDRFRVYALEKLLKKVDAQNKRLIEDVLVQKYTLLLKGAKKHDKIQDIDKYIKKIKRYKSE